MSKDKSKSKGKTRTKSQDKLINQDQGQGKKQDSDKDRLHLDTFSIGIAVSKFNSDITDNLLVGAERVFGEGLEECVQQWWEGLVKRPELELMYMTDELRDSISSRYKSANINLKITRVPGSFELPLGVQWLAQDKVVGVVALGAIIQGETSHHDHLAEAVSQGLMRVNLNHRIPLGFGLITANNYEQAQERADVDAFKSAAAAKRSAKGGKSNKGYEAASAVLEMLLERDFSYKLRELARNAPAK